MRLLLAPCIAVNVVIALVGLTAIPAHAQQADALAPGVGEVSGGECV